MYIFLFLSLMMIISFIFYIAVDTSLPITFKIFIITLFITFALIEIIAIVIDKIKELILDSEKRIIKNK